MDIKDQLKTAYVSYTNCNTKHFLIFVWCREHKKMIMQIEDLLGKAKVIQMLKVSKELQAVSPQTLSHLLVLLQSFKDIV